MLAPGLQMGRLRVQGDWGARPFDVQHPKLLGCLVSFPANSVCPSAVHRTQGSVFLLLSLTCQTGKDHSRKVHRK